MDPPDKFDFREECNKAGIDVNGVYEPYKHAWSHVLTAEFLQKPPSETDLALIKRLESEYPSIRKLASNHTAWVKAQREGAKERSSC